MALSNAESVGELLRCSAALVKSIGPVRLAEQQAFWLTPGISLWISPYWCRSCVGGALAAHFVKRAPERRLGLPAAPHDAATAGGSGGGSPARRGPSLLAASTASMARWHAQFADEVRLCARGRFPAARHVLRGYAARTDVPAPEFAASAGAVDRTPPNRGARG